MAVNTSHRERGIVIYNGEHILTYAKHVSMALKCDTPQTDAAMFKGTKHGQLYLTTHRVIFRNKNESDGLRSFCMPFSCMHNVTLQQPVLGANYLQGTAHAMPNGNMEGQAQFKLTFGHGGCIEFGQTLLRAVDMASRFTLSTAPPPYSEPTGGVFNPPPDYYSAGTFAGFAMAPGAAAAFPDTPNPSDVYMYEAPPPYPGLAPTEPTPHRVDARQAPPPYPAA